MITFKRIYEALFHSFRISGANALIAELRTENIEKIYIIRRSWIYGVFVSLMLFLLILLLGTEAYFEKEIYQTAIIFYSISTGILAFNTVWILFAGIAYLRFYKRNHQKLYDLSQGKEYRAIESLILMEGRVFNHFFNQVTGSYFIAIILFGYHLHYYTSVSHEAFGYFALLDIFLSLIVVFLIAFYRRKMIDLEMDYIIVVAGKIYFIDQSWVYKKIQALRLYSNIRFITSSFPNFLGSLLNYGSIEIITKNDFTDSATTFHMHYIDHPIETVNQIHLFMAGKMSEWV